MTAPTIALTGILHNEETKEKMSNMQLKVFKEGKRKSYELTDPQGHTYHVVNLQTFCNIFNLSRSTLEKSFRRQMPVKYGKTFGWSIKSSRNLTAQEWYDWKDAALPY